VLVAGATGYLGQFVVRELKSRGYLVRALARSPEKLDYLREVSRIPEWLIWLVVRLVRLCNRHQGELLAFFATMATSDVIAPATGTYTLEAHYQMLGGER
jgi:nucleoside-diphosphate-sugar epimerase